MSMPAAGGNADTVYVRHGRYLEPVMILFWVRNWHTLRRDIDEFGGTAAEACPERSRRG